MTTKTFQHSLIAQRLSAAAVRGQVPSWREDKMHDSPAGTITYRPGIGWRIGVGEGRAEVCIPHTLVLATEKALRGEALSARDMCSLKVAPF